VEFRQLLAKIDVALVTLTGQIFYLHMKSIPIPTQLYKDQVDIPRTIHVISK
jgi:hypothetical protein